jgi:ketosteroid isomerase-like protein
MTTTRQRTDETEQGVLALVDEWAQAERTMDSPALDGLLADDFVGIGPYGFLLSREQWVQRYESGVLKQQAFALEDPTVRLHGDTAVVIGSQNQQTTYQGNDVSGRFRATLIALRSGGEWRLEGLHLSPQADAAPPLGGPGGPGGPGAPGGRGRQETRG